jgi:hypothetical protein
MFTWLHSSQRFAASADHLYQHGAGAGMSIDLMKTEWSPPKDIATSGHGYIDKLTGLSLFGQPIAGKSQSISVECHLRKRFDSAIEQMFGM